MAITSTSSVAATNAVRSIVRGPSALFITVALFFCFVGLIGTIIFTVILDDSALFIASIGTMSLGFVMFLIALITTVHVWDIGRMCGLCVCCDEYRFHPDTQPQVTQERSHTLDISLLLPPWEEQHMLIATVEPTVPLSHVQLFSAQFHSLVEYAASIALAHTRIHKQYK